MVSDRTIRLSFPARAEFLILGRLALVGTARAVPIPEEILADLKLAVTEACGNVVRHAYGGEEGTVRLTIDARPKTITVTVEDDGVGLVLDGPAGAIAEDGALESGMGLAIIEAIADELVVVTDHARGTALTFTKALVASPV